MIVAYGAVAVFIAWIWVDYYRLIDIYDRDKLINFLLAFIIGFLSVPIALFFGDYVLNPTGWDMNGNFINDLFYTFIGIGLLEEVSKLISFLVFAAIMHKKITEPIDVIAYYCTAALGFAALENVLYFTRYGGDIIFARAILSTVGHMFDAALVAYGYILFKYRYQSKPILLLPGFLLIGALAHGIYDFLLMYEGIPFSYLIFFLYFFLTISLFATILNNALNHSAFFSYKRVIDSDRVVNKLLSYYIILIGCQFVLVWITKENIYTAFGSLLTTIFTAGLVVIVASVRLSRFKLIDDRWHPLRLELPFTLFQNDMYGVTSTYFKIQIKGDGYNQTFINQYYEDFFELRPVSKNMKSYLNTRTLGYVERKLFLAKDETHYVIRLYDSDKHSNYETHVLRPKTKGMMKVADKYPIVGLMKIDPLPEETSFRGKVNGKLYEWVYLKPLSI
jgi:RsiW-degrading membrane proteinase PrsW (M82 family)